MKYLLVLLALLVCSCSSLPPEKRVASWEDWHLCENLADYTFKGASRWLWHTSVEIEKRGLDKDPRCESIYEVRMKALVRKYERADLTISFGEALNSDTSFDEATAK